MAKKSQTRRSPTGHSEELSVVEMVETYLRREKRSRAMFQEVQGLLAAIAARSKPGQTFRTKAGTVQLVDKFADRDLVFKNTAINRFELRVVAG